MIKIAIDADSILYKACYRVKNEDGIVDTEDAYYEFENIIENILLTMMFTLGINKKFKVKIVFSPSKSFRNIIYPDYKANRSSVRIMGVADVKHLALERMDNAILVDNIEADDVVIYLAIKHKYYISAFDKDILNASPTMSYNYNTHRWHQSNTYEEAERWYYAQALMGDGVDNIKGAKGIGEVGAWKWVNKFEGEMPDWEEFVEMFDYSEVDATLSMQLVRMDQLVMYNKKLRVRLWRR